MSLTVAFTIYYTRNMVEKYSLTMLRLAEIGQELFYLNVIFTTAQQLLGWWHCTARSSMHQGPTDPDAVWYKAAVLGGNMYTRNQLDPSKRL